MKYLSSTHPNETVTVSQASSPGRLGGGEGLRTTRPSPVVSHFGEGVNHFFVLSQH